MKFLIGIENVDNILYSRLHNWLLDHVNKWIIKKTFDQDEKITFILHTKNFSSLTNCINSLKKTCLSVKKIEKNEKKCGETLKFKNNIFLKKTITTDDKFINILNDHFFNNILNINEKNDNIFENIELKGYTKKFILSNLKNNIDIEKKICEMCHHKFKTTANCIRHQKTYCKKNNNIQNKNKNKDKDNNNKEIKNINEDAIDNINEKLKEFISNITQTNNVLNNTINNTVNNNNTINNTVNNNTVNNNTVNNNTVNNNTINIQVSNVLTKKDKLNIHLDKVIDIDTFTENYENNSKYHLTKDESQILLENSEHSGIIGYCEGLSTYLKKKYCLQLKDLTGDIQKYNECVLPFISNDCNLRTHYEKLNEGWVLVKSNDKIRKLVNISDKQIFNHHNRFIYYPKIGKKLAVNILLRKSDYLTIERMLDNNKIDKIK